MTIETARSASLEFVCIFGHDELGVSLFIRPVCQTPAQFDSTFKRPLERCKLLTRWAFEYFDQTTNAHPERESIPVPTPEKQDREGQKHKQGFQLVRQKRPAVLKARIESEKGQAAERAAYAVFCQPLGYETNERRQDKRAQDDGQPQAKEREVASPLGRDDPDPVKKRRLRVLESRRGLQRKPSAARSRQARDLNVGRFVPDMRDVETVERVQIGRQGEDEYPQPPEAHGFVISQWCSLHAQRLDRINAGRTPGRKVAREESGESENHGHRDEYGRVERAHAK